MTADKFEEHVKWVQDEAKGMRKFRAISPKYQKDRFADWRGSGMINNLMQQVSMKMHSLFQGAKERDQVLLEDLDRLTVDTLNYLLFLNAALHEEWENEHILNEEPFGAEFKDIKVRPTTAVLSMHDQPERDLSPGDTAKIVINGEVVLNIEFPEWEVTK